VQADVGWAEGALADWPAQHDRRVAGVDVALDEDIPGEPFEGSAAADVLDERGDADAGTVARYAQRHGMGGLAESKALEADEHGRHSVAKLHIKAMTAGILRLEHRCASEPHAGGSVRH
jgi:hypothetical protein